MAIDPAQTIQQPAAAATAPSTTASVTATAPTPVQAAQAVQALQQPLQVIEADLSTEKPPAGLLWGLVALIVVAVVVAVGYLLVESVNGNPRAAEYLVPVAVFLAGVVAPSPIQSLLVRR